MPKDSPAHPTPVPSTGADTHDILALWPSLRDLQLTGRFVDVITRMGGRDGVLACFHRAQTPWALARMVRILRCGGNHRGSYLLARKLWRRWPEEPCVQATWLPFLASFNSLEAILFLDRRGTAVPEGLDDELSLHWLQSRCSIWAELRMFDEARRLSDEARERWPHHPWAQTLLPMILASQDRRAEALSEVERIREIHPRAPFPHYLRVHYLALLHRPDEAIRAADESLGIVQEDGIARIAASLLVEAGRRSEALGFLERALPLMPLADRSALQGLRTAMLECLYLDERFDEAAEVARTIIAKLPRRAPSPERKTYPERILDAVTDPDLRSRSRIVLPVPFVAQDHNTCSPASLASIAGAWTRPGSHDEIAAEICSEGTPMELSRDWAERHGWATAEFLPDVPSTLALIRRRVPFAIHTAWLGGAHSQTLMGFDERTRTAIVREPTVPRFIECLLESRWKILPQHSLVGLVMVPRDSDAATAIGDIHLPSREQMTLAHRVRLGWRSGDEAGAEQAFEEMLQRYPEDDVALSVTADRAERRGDDERALAAIELLAERYPDDDLLVRRHAALLRNMGRIDRAEQALARRIATRRAAPGLLLDQAWTWADRGVSAERIERVVIRAAARGHKLAECLPFLAELLIRDGRLDEAERLLRMNTFLSPGHRGSNDHWLETLRRLGRLDQAIEELEDRYHRADEDARELLRLLTAALWSSGRRSEAAEHVEQAAERWPDDREIAVLRVRYRRAVGRLADADAALAALDGRINRPQWLSERALNAEARQDRLEAMRTYKELLAIDPTSPQAWHGLRELAEHPQALDGLAEELEMHFARMPSYWPVADALASLYSQRDPGRGIGVLRRHLDVFPSNAEGWLRLARLKRGVGDLAGAITAVERSVEAIPHSADAWALLADLRYDSGDRDGSRKAAERALDLGPGDGSSIDRIVRTIPSMDARCDWLRERWSRVLQPPLSPPTILHLAWSSVPPLPPDEVQEMIARCPMTAEFEPIHAAAAHILARANRYAEAVAVTDRMVGRYAHSERLRGLRCELLIGAKDWAAAIRDAEAWIAASPFATQPFAILFAAHSALNQTDRRADALRRWSELSPDDTSVSVRYARALLDMGKSEEAQAHLAAQWARSLDVNVAWTRLDLLHTEGNAVAYLQVLKEMLPHLKNVEATIEAVFARFPGAPWLGQLWWDALRDANDQSPPGVRAAWGCHAIARETPRWVLKRMVRQFSSDEARGDVLEALAHAGAYRHHAALTRRLIREHGDLARRRANTLTSIADGLWVAGRRHEIPMWLTGWEAREDLVAGDLWVLARILDASGDHRGAIAAAMRGASIADGSQLAGLLAIRAVALIQCGEFDEARVRLQTVTEIQADDESEAIAEWGLKALALLEGPSAPDRAALKSLSEKAKEMDRIHETPIVDSLLRAIATALLAKGARRRDLSFAPSELGRLMATMSEWFARQRVAMAHAGFDNDARWRRLFRANGNRYA
ncbi:MAG: hypothetical protein JNL80_08420 [Phycisphaerae bacterium]|nr:hypothetical protein [Phycisphaerae bacterium]